MIIYQQNLLTLDSHKYWSMYYKIYIGWKCLPLYIYLTNHGICFELDQ